MGAGEVATRAEGDASAKVGRINENGSMGMVDPQCRMIGLHIYDAIIKVAVSHAAQTVTSECHVKLHIAPFFYALSLWTQTFDD